MLSSILAPVYDFWRKRSLRFMLATGMGFVVLPLAASLVAGYLIHQRHIIQPLVDIVARQHEVLLPLHRLQSGLLEVSTQVEDYLVRGNGDGEAFRGPGEDIERAFADLRESTRGDSDEGRAVAMAQARWRSASAFLGSIGTLGVAGIPSDNQQAFVTFEADVLETARQLELVAGKMGQDSERAFKEILDTLSWTELISLTALILSIAMTIIGIQLIYRTLVASMDELSEGALRLAEGDRDNKINVTIPMELAKVADTFNRMTEKILEQEEALVTAATVDSLTGLYNRREFDRVLEDEVKRSLRYGTAVALILIDIDHFKRFNDSHGHQGGDEALRVVSETLLDGIRRVDKAFRYGGEELALILPSSDLETAARTAERLRATIEEMDIKLSEGDPARVTVSLGVAVCPDQAEDEEGLVAAADAALYKAKEDGRNRVVRAPAS